MSTSRIHAIEIDTYATAAVFISASAQPTGELSIRTIEAAHDPLGLAEVSMGGLLGDVNHRRLRAVHDLPTRGSDPAAPLFLLAVQEDRRVEAARRLEDLAANEHARPDHPVDHEHEPPAALPWFALG